MLQRRLVGVGLIVALVVVLLAVPKASVSAGYQPGSGITYLPGQTKMNPAYSAGTTVGGVACGPGVRQVPWSDYAPPCEAAWHGNNGGATAPGVTATTITLSTRLAATSLLPALYAIVPPDVVGTNQEAVQSLQAYINVFNKTFELYGRKVVLAPFQGQGNFIAEDTGTGAPQAEADAVNVAHSIKAFADMSLIDSSVTYTQDLAAQKVIAFGLYLQDRQWFQERQPYEYTPGPNCTKSASAIGALYGQQLKGQKAMFAKGGLQNNVRKLGILYVNTPEAHQCEQAIVSALARNGVTPAATAAITFDLSKLTDESANAIAQMKKAGVTTIICSSCDPISPKYYLSAADQADYHPEWFLQSLFSSGATTGDKFIRLYSQDQLSQIMTVGPVPAPAPESEAYHAFELGNTDPKAQIIPTYPYVYASVLQLFDALQLAGPNLTPANLQTAMRAIPKSLPGGELGGWDGASGPYDPASSFQVLKWAPAATSPVDGQRGTFYVCDGGASFPYQPNLTMPTGPLDCKPTTGVPHTMGTLRTDSRATGASRGAGAP